MTHPLAFDEKNRNIILKKSKITDKICFFIAQRKLKKRNIYTLMEDLIRRFTLSRETVRAGILFWRECSDNALRRRQLTTIETMSKQIGHGDVKSLFS